MQSQHLHLQSVDSQQMHPREQRPHPQHLQQHQQHHSFQIHHLQQQRQHQSRLHQQPSHPQSHHQPHPQSLQQQHLQSSHQQRQHTQHHTRQHQQPSVSHPQHHLFPHQSSQLGSLALSTNNTTAAFPVSSTPNHNNPQFTAHALTRDNLQPLQHHQQSQQSHFQAPLSQPALHHQNPAQNTNSFANSEQPIQMQPLLPSQQPNQAAFGNLANIPGSMLQAAVVDDNPANPHQFANSQSGDALTSAYPWESAHSAHGALTTQNLAAANHTNQQQPLLPISLVGDTRANNSQAFAAQNASGPNSFGGALNPNMGVLSSSLNNSMVGGLVNGNSLAPNVGNVAPALPPTAADLSQRNSFSIGEGPQRPTKIIKKASGRAAQQKNVPSRVRNVRGPITSPVSTATLPNMSQPSAVGSNTQLEHAGVSSQNTGMGSMVASPPHTVRQARGIQGGKAKGRMRVPSRGMDSGEVPGPGAISSSNTSVGMVALAPNQVRDDPVAGSTTMPMPGTLTPQSFGDAKNAASATVTWSTPKKASASRSSRRRKGDGTTTSLPVHLRNPKKGRARVFRECKACRQENHIRRSDCQNCNAPLPAGKRRRDGNPVYDSKRRLPSAAGTVSNSHVVSQGVGRGRSGVKDDLVPSVMSK